MTYVVWQVWTPGLKLEDGAGGAVSRVVDTQNVYVIKASRPLPDDVTILSEGGCVQA